MGRGSSQSQSSFALQEVERFGIVDDSFSDLEEKAHLYSLKRLLSAAKELRNWHSDLSLPHTALEKLPQLYRERGVRYLLSEEDLGAQALEFYRSLIPCSLIGRGGTTFDSFLWVAQDIAEVVPRFTPYIALSSSGEGHLIADLATRKTICGQSVESHWTNPAPRGSLQSALSHNRACVKCYSRAMNWPAESPVCQAALEENRPSIFDEGEFEARVIEEVRATASQSREDSQLFTEALSGESVDERAEFVLAQMTAEKILGRPAPERIEALLGGADNFDSDTKKGFEFIQVTLEEEYNSLPALPWPNLDELTRYCHLAILKSNSLSHASTGRAELVGRLLADYWPNAGIRVAEKYKTQSTPALWLISLLVNETLI
jgi:hypothetical protein